MAQRKKSVVIELEEPLNIDGKEITKLEMRRPTAGDSITAQEVSDKPAVQELHLFGALCGVNPESLRPMDLREYQKLQGVFSDFLA